MTPEQVKFKIYHLTDRAPITAELSSIRFLPISYARVVSLFLHIQPAGFAWGYVMNDLVLSINGKNQHVSSLAEESLLTVLRDRLGLTGTKYGCGEGQCGACTVLLDGKATRSCITPVTAAVGAKITTIEGLEQNGALSPIQQAFLDEGAFQCGYCTSGMVLSATALLRETHHPSDEQIVQHMNGNICRCGTYPRIVQAIKRASQSLGKGESR
jgi:aerobic-type carbon monoxide dehydrogenase small subunit (CoxS/CutS family)